MIKPPSYSLTTITAVKHKLKAIDQLEPLQYGYDMVNTMELDCGQKRSVWVTYARNSFRTNLQSPATTVTNITTNLHSNRCVSFGYTCFQIWNVFPSVEPSPFWPTPVQWHGAASGNSDSYLVFSSLTCVIVSISLVPALYNGTQYYHSRQDVPFDKAIRGKFVTVLVLEVDLFGVSEGMEQRTLIWVR